MHVKNEANNHLSLSLICCRLTYSQLGTENVLIIILYKYTCVLIYRNIILIVKGVKRFSGGLSLHLNHLIASRMANYDWPFGTLPFGLFGSNLDTRDLETYPGTYSGSFLKYVNFWRFQGHLSTFQKMGGLRKLKFSWWRSDHYPLIGLVLGGEIPRLNHGPICFPIQNT